MIKITINLNQRREKQLLFWGVLTGLMVHSSGPALADYTSDGNESTTVKSPLIQGALFTPANVAPQEGMPPPVGDGATAPPVTPGMGGEPNLPTWITRSPANQINQTNTQIQLPYDPSTTNSPRQLGPLIGTPPLPPLSSVTPLVPDPGLIQTKPTNVTQGSTNSYSTNPNSALEMNTFTPPVDVAGLGANGGIVPQGTVPITKWGGQTVRDLGLNQVDRSQLAGEQNKLGAQTADFGQNISTLSSVTSRGITRRVSQDGPRPYIAPAAYSLTSFKPPLISGAQETQDLNGDRIMFKGPNLRSQMTIAPY